MFCVQSDVIHNSIIIYRAAELPSYAVIDFCSTSKPSAQDTMLDFFAAMERHGMTIPNNGRSKLNDLIISAPPHLDLDSVSMCLFSSLNFYIYC